MFIVAQMPLADLRPLTADRQGRLGVPDWTQDDPGRGFVRGFGAVAARNLSSLGIAGESAFADFGRAARFAAPIPHSQPGWPRPLLIEPWFRRCYFDGRLAGRFEFGFLVGDEAEDEVFAEGGATPYDPRAIAATVEAIRLRIHGSDLPPTDATLAGAGEALGLAYLAATTKRSALAAFPIAETIGGTVALGPLSIHLRVSGGRGVQASRASRPVPWDAGEDLLLTTATGARRSPVLVTRSEAGALDETAEERAVRVLFSHLNGLIFALSHFIQAEASLAGSIGRKRIVEAVRAAIERLGGFKPTGPQAAGDARFAAAIQAFGQAHAGRLDQLTTRLRELAAALGQPTGTDKVLGYLKSLVDLVVTTGVKTGVEAAIKAGKAGG